MSNKQDTNEIQYEDCGGFKTDIVRQKDLTAVCKSFVNIENINGPKWNLVEY